MTDMDEAALAAAVGPAKAGFYLPRFASLQRSSGGWRWHWPAFFLTFYWLLYRKMWWQALVYYFLPSVVLTVLILAFRNAPTGFLLTVLALGVLAWAALPALLADRLYLAHCKRLIRKASASSPSREHLLGRLTAKGGTSTVVAVLALVVTGTFTIGMLAAIALPAYQDYAVRARLTQAMASTDGLKRELLAHHSRHGAFPSTLDGFAIPAGQFVQSVQLSRNHEGAFVLLADVGMKELVGIEFHPVQSQSGTWDWDCSAPERMHRLVPEQCRK